ncbi:hypothetical protein DJ521_01020 [Sulfolobus sp. E3]|nr:hypothetical protein DJ521_01020 [Sulfolobus sp. E3]
MNIVEIYLNIYSFREVISRFLIEDKKDNWITMRENNSKELYLAEEFNGDYGLIIYPYKDIEDDIKEAFSHYLYSVNKLKEVLYASERWRDSIDIKIEGNKIVTMPSLDLDLITGVDLINSVVSNKGFIYKVLDDSLVIEIEIKRPLIYTSLNDYIKLLYYALKLYYDVKRTQEDI